jgi:two-component system sensor histidine kinase CpxA
VSVFTKIFTAFWIALALSMLATIALYPPTLHNALQHRNFLEQSFQIMADQLADDYERGGKHVVQEAVERVRSQRGIQLAFYDDDSNLIAGGLPEHLQSRVGSLFSGIRPGRGEPLVVTLNTTSTAGKQYRVLMAIPANFLETRPSPLLIFYRALIIALVSGLVCYAAAKYLTGPIVMLRGAAQRLASGDLSARAPRRCSGPADEVGGLIRDFNLMAEKIEALMTAQRRLVSDVSHELRSPLARLNVGVSLAREKQGEDLGRTLDRIEKEAARLNQLVGQILRVSELEVTMDSQSHDLVDLSDVLRRVADDGRYEARQDERDVVITTLVPCWIRGDKELLGSAIENVVRNAIRYTSPETSVEVSSALDGGLDSPKAIVRVRDHGPGLPEHELEQIFQPFYRVSYDRGRKTGGSGLGLSITQRAIQLHGGTVSAKNAEGGGLVMEIELPVVGVEG